jgi:hypothetical protein
LPLDQHGQGPLDCLDKDALGFDEHGASQSPECDTPPPLTPAHDPHNNQNTQHTSDHNQGAEGNQGLDNEVVPGCEAQPDDIPGGQYKWHPDDIVPHIKNLIDATEYVKYLEAATLDNDSIPEYIWDRM